MIRKELVQFKLEVENNEKKEQEEEVKERPDTVILLEDDIPESPMRLPEVEILSSSDTESEKDENCQTFFNLQAP